MTKICLINVWMGKLPEWFSLWRKSAEMNPTVDFYLVTDQKVEASSNVHIVPMSFEECRNRFQKCFDFPITLQYSYKLCDFKPVFALAFPEIVEGYDFWGHMDLDLILGDIRAFLTDDMLEKYDRVFEVGILSLYRNNEEMNHFFEKSALKENKAYSYKAAFRTNYACYLDEYMGMNILSWKYMGNRVFRDQTTENMIQDFSWQNLDFKSYITGESFVFWWDNGKLYRYLCDETGRIEENRTPKEYMLVHIQKRKMEIRFDTKTGSEIDSFWIVPNAYQKERPEGPLYSQEEKTAYSAMIAKQDKERSIRNMKNYGVSEYIPHFFRSRSIRKWINTVKKFY